MTVWLNIPSDIRVARPPVGSDLYRKPYFLPPAACDDCGGFTLKASTMSGHPAKLAEHYRELAEGEVTRAKRAATNEARADHYARAAEHLRLAKAAEEFGFSDRAGIS